MRPRKTDSYELAPSPSSVTHLVYLGHGLVGSIGDVQVASIVIVIYTWSKSITVEQIYTHWLSKGQRIPPVRDDQRSPYTPSPIDLLRRYDTRTDAPMKALGVSRDHIHRTKRTKSNAMRIADPERRKLRLPPRLVKSECSSGLMLITARSCM